MKRIAVDKSGAAPAAVLGNGGAVTPAFLAWRLLAHEKGRSALALIGVFIAILLVFIELGFFVSVPQGGMLVYDHMRFDLLLVSKDYIYQAMSGQFPPARLREAAAVPGVKQASPLYFAAAKWQDPGGGLRLDLFAIGFDPAAHPFAVDGIEQQGAMLGERDTVLVDNGTRANFGPLTTGREVLINGRRMTIGGTYDLGTGFLGLGIAVMDEANFSRTFAGRHGGPVNLGLITLADGADPDRIAADLRRALPDDVQVFTRAGLEAREDAYWTTRTSVGLIFGSGLVVAFIVGTMVLYQALATQITRHLPEFATLKAIGYSNARLDAVVAIQSLAVTTVAFVPAVAAALAIYALLRRQTLLPVALTPAQLVAVLAITLVMATASALLSLRGLRRADPADLFS